MKGVGGAADFPRTLWMLWFQGWDNAPELVKRCLHSWQHHNRGWTIRLLDADTLPAFVDLSDFSSAPDTDFPIYVVSEFVRLDLLKRYGGVWVDATCFCRRPLDEWLFEYLHSGFFSFERGGGLTGWFLAAAPGNRAIDLWWAETRAYWRGCPPVTRASLKKNPRLIDRVLRRACTLRERSLSPSRTGDWLLRALGLMLKRYPEVVFSPLFRNVLRTVPYYWFSESFAVCYKKYPEVRRIWDDSPKLRATGLIELGGSSGCVLPCPTAPGWAIDEQRCAPVYKLNWRLDLTKAGPGSFLDYPFSTVPGGDEVDDLTAPAGTPEPCFRTGRDSPRGP